MRKAIPLTLIGLLALAQPSLPADSPSAPADPPAVSSSASAPESTQLPAAATPDAMPHESGPSIPVVPNAGQAQQDDNWLWARGEYLLWWLRPKTLPPLVTTSPSGTAQASAGVLGASGTQVLYGQNAINGDARSGGRFELGYWLDRHQVWALSANFLFLEDKAAHFSTSSTGSPILARPFLNSRTGAQDAELVAFPGVLNGQVSVTSPSRDVLGTEVSLEETVLNRCNGRLVALIGYRFLKLDEGVSMNESLTATGANNPFGVAAGTNIAVADAFAARNEFHGGNFGMEADWWRNNLHLALTGKLAVGYTHESIDITGSTTSTVPGAAPATNVGGLLALPSNIGHSSRSEVALIPEFGVNVGYQVTDYLLVQVGYSFLYWGDVVRASDQIDFTIDRTQLPPNPSPSSGARPQRTFAESDLWLQGINLGVQLRY